MMGGGLYEAAAVALVTVVLVLPPKTTVSAAIAPDEAIISCDIAVAGGSTASLAAAITAAEAAPELSVCLTDWTDWPGGQMTAGGVPAIDFGGLNWRSENQPASFRAAMSTIPGDGAPYDPVLHIGSGSPGACSVSTKCYLPNRLVERWIMPRLRRSVCPHHMHSSSPAPD
jgi:hypothetical protein